MALLAGSLTSLALALAPGAFAAAPELPVTEAATAVTATEATLHGTLNPNVAGEPGSYQFSYKPAPALTPECTTGANLAPASPLADAGAQGEAETLTVKGLEPSREYAFCIVAYSLAGGLSEPADGAALPFTTLPAAPAVDSETATVTSTAATLEAQVNPNNQATSYSFEYTATEAAGKLTGTVTTLTSAEGLAAEFGDRSATVPRITGLVPGTTYFYRVVVENASHEKTEGAVRSFTTVPTPHTDVATAVTATTATFGGHLTLDSGVTDYSFDYNVGSQCTGSSTEPVEATAATVSTNVTALQPSATYSVCLVTSNAFGSEVDPTIPPQTFTTLAATPNVDGESVPSLTPFEAALEAQVNPNNQATTYEFEYATSTAALGTSAANKLKAPAGTPVLTGYGDQAVSVPTGQVLVAGQTYHYRVIAANATGETEGAGEFTTPIATAPTVEGETVTSTTALEAKLEAQVKPSYQQTACSVRYWVAAAAESTALTTPCTPPGALLGSEDSPVAVTATLANLTPDLTYDYRVVATNGTGETPGALEAFTTRIAPTVTPGAAGEVTEMAATLAGATVDPNGAETTYHYAYIGQSSYEFAFAHGVGFRSIDSPLNPYQNGTSTPAVLVGSDSSVHAIAAVALSELVPGTTYHYALIATNTAGTTVIGPDQTFTTIPVPVLPASAPESSSPAPATLSSPVTIFPDLTGIVPRAESPQGALTSAPGKPLMRSQKREKALKGCKRDKNKDERQSCERSARKRYGTTKKKGNK